MTPAITSTKAPAPAAAVSGAGQAGGAGGQAARVHHEVVAAGFGGQGILFLGLVLAEAGLAEGREVSWVPSYGPEMRGGTAHCMVVLSNRPIASPIVVAPTALVAMNGPSFERFVGRVRAGGLVVVNTSLVDGKARAQREQELRFIRVPATEVASDLGNPKVANVVALGALAQTAGLVSPESLSQALEKLVGTRRPELLELNLKALKAGMAAARSSG